MLRVSTVILAPASCSFRISAPVLPPRDATTTTENEELCANAKRGSAVCRFLPDRMLRTQDTPRTVSLVVLAVLTLAACFLNAFAQIEWFATAAGVTGFAFGGIQGIVPALASEIFGLRYLATNYSMLQLGPAICEPPVTVATA